MGTPAGPLVRSLVASVDATMAVAETGVCKAQAESAGSWCRAHGAQRRSHDPADCASAAPRGNAPKHPAVGAAFIMNCLGGESLPLRPSL